MLLTVAADGLLFSVMPFVAGETLRSRLERERQLPLDDAIRNGRWLAYVSHAIVTASICNRIRLSRTAYLFIACFLALHSGS